jgi:hypothetical protein
MNMAITLKCRNQYPILGWLTSVDGGSDNPGVDGLLHDVGVATTVVAVTMAAAAWGGWSCCW